MEASERGQVTSDAASVYEEFFVPALFGEWPDRVLDAAGVVQGQELLDVACGTGVLAREASGRVGAGGRVVGLDINDGMLAAARSANPDVEWVQGPAEQLPFGDGEFDAVVSQFGLMFFDDQVRALREMARVARPGGSVAVAVWGSLEETPGYARMAGLLEQLFGAEVATALQAPYSLGETDDLRALFIAAGIETTHIETVTGEARFDSIESWVHTDIRGWTLAEVLDDGQYAALLELALTELQTFTDPAGRVRFDAPAHLATSKLD